LQAQIIAARDDLPSGMLVKLWGGLLSAAPRGFTSNMHHQVPANVRPSLIQGGFIAQPLHHEINKGRIVYDR